MRTAVLLAVWISFPSSLALALDTARELRTSATADEAQPRVKAEETLHDWGEIYHGRTVEHRFRLENRGTEKLRLQEIETSCGCTFGSADIPEDGVAPGESFTVTVRIETAKLPKEQAISGERIRKSARVISADGVTLATLWMEGQVREVLRFEPKETVFRIVHDDRAPPPAPARIIARPAIDAPLGIGAIKAESGSVTARASKPRADGSIEIVLEPDLSRREKHPRTADTLLVAVRIGDETEEVLVPYPVAVIFERRIRCEPSASCFFPRRVTRSAKEGGELPRRELEIQSAGTAEHRFAIRKVETEKGLVRTHVEPIEDGRRYRLTIELLAPKGDASGVTNDRITVHTDDKLAEEIAIPVTIQW